MICTSYDKLLLGQLAWSRENQREKARRKRRRGWKEVRAHEQYSVPWFLGSANISLQKAKPPRLMLSKINGRELQSLPK